jgi:hypothetical protein
LKDCGRSEAQMLVFRLWNPLSHLVVHHSIDTATLSRTANRAEFVQV